ncbi:MAG: hypothetical protein GY865_17220 [candidate division Zixibacteria bacterium]|nr:hypothetical protein [candidate division Zixibacteria bacterium]
MKYGIDINNMELQLAGCNNSGGRIVIDSLGQHGLDELNPDMINNSGELQFSIPEDKAIIKKVKVPSDKNIDKKELAEFEFMSTLIDKNEDLYIKTNSVNGGTEYLVYGCHRDLVDQKKKFFEDKLMKPSGYKLRALALADGYQKYCWREGGELICLLDLSSLSASYCFLNKDQPIFIGSVINSDTDNTNNDTISESFLSDIRTTIQFQKANLFKAGYTTPLSLIVVTGTLAGKKTNEIFEEKLQLRTISPTIKTALFTPDVVDRAGHFLISLGLTVSD